MWWSPVKAERMRIDHASRTESRARTWKNTLKTQGPDKFPTIYQYRRMLFSVQKPLSYHKNTLYLTFFPPIFKDSWRSYRGSTLVSKALLLSMFVFVLVLQFCFFLESYHVCSRTSAICWQRAGSCGTTAQEADRKSKSVTCQLWMSPDKRGRHIETAWLRMCV